MVMVVEVVVIIVVVIIIIVVVIVVAVVVVVVVVVVVIGVKSEVGVDQMIDETTAIEDTVATVGIEGTETGMIIGIGEMMTGEDERKLRPYYLLYMYIHGYYAKA